MAVIYEPKGMAREYAPLACNLYRGCLHGCRYCYAPGCLFMRPEEFWARSTRRPGVLQELAKDARKHANGDLPVLFCFTSDAYQPNEDGTTRAALEIMRDARCQFQVLTKGGTRAVRDIDVFAAMGCAPHVGPTAFGTTLLFTHDDARREWEPNAAPVADRIDAIRSYHAAGIRTWVSIEPVIDPAQAVRLVETLSPWVDEWRVGKLNHHPHAKTVDWKRFATDVHASLEASGRDYMIKDALRPYLPPGAEVRRYAVGEAQAVGVRQLRLCD